MNYGRHMFTKEHLQYSTIVKCLRYIFCKANLNLYLLYYTFDSIKICSIGENSSILSLIERVLVNKVIEKEGTSERESIAVRISCQRVKSHAQLVICKGKACD